MSVEQKPAFKVVVTAGPNEGCEYIIPAAGARVGRSSQNDIALTDPLLSRHHCRFERRGAELWVVDLASANQTLVNGKPVEETRLAPSDQVTIGDTVMRVTAMDVEPPVAAPAVHVAASADKPVIDLGLSQSPDAPSSAARHALRPLLWSIAAAAVLLLGATFILDNRKSGKSAVRPVADTRDATLQIAYEKVEADAGGIFRYEMKLTPEHMLAIRIDDLKENRHLRQEKRVDPGLLQGLAEELLASGFFKLEPAYTGINSHPGALDSWDLTIVVGKTAQRCRVANRLEPEVFRSVREKLETFGKNELGIWAIQFARDKLIGLASDACRAGRKRYEERDIQYDNLDNAIQRFKEAEFYLATVDPKPDFYAEIADGRRLATDELDRRYQEQSFRADRAINLQDWPVAAQELRVLRELVPDRNDDRNKESTRKLLDVEARINARKR